MKKLSIILIFLVSFFSVFSQSIPSLQQRTNGQTTVADPNLFSLRSFKVPVYTDTTSANTSWPTLDSAGKIIYTLDTKNFWVRQIPPRRWKKVLNAGDVIDSISVTDSSICQWKDGVADCKIFNTIINIPSLSDALISVQGISLVDTTVTIIPNIVSRRDNIQFTQTTSSVFQVNKADSGYSRFDLIYIDSLNVIRLIEGVQDTGVVVPPAMPPHGIQVTIVSIVGDVVHQPVPSISTNYWSPNGNNITSGTAYLGTLNSKSLDFLTGGTVKATLDTIGQLRFPLVNNGNYPHALTFYNNVDATVPSFNLAVNSGYGEITLRPTNSGYIYGFRMKKSADADSLVGSAYSSMYLQDYGKLKYNTLASQTSAFEVTQANTPLFTVNSTTKPGAYFGSDTTYKPSSALTVSSTTQGILVPRMTTTQMNAIGTPSNGLLIYNLDSTAFYYYQLSAWVKIATGSGSSTQDTLFVRSPLKVNSTNDTLYMNQASAFDSGWISPQQALLIEAVPTAVESIVAITGSSFENTHIDGSKDTVIIRGSGWSLTGNAGTDSTVNFIGTTDNVNFMIRANDVYVGKFYSENKSFAFGDLNATTIIGTSSGAFGATHAISGNYSFAFGSDNIISGSASLASGSDINISSNNSSAFGNQHQLTGLYSFATGTSNHADGQASFAMGNSTTAQGSYSLSGGISSTAVGNGSLSFGNSTYTTGINSAALNYSTTTNGDYSTALGFFSTTNSINSVALGRYNVGVGSANDTAVLLEIGNGYNNFAKSNIVTVTYNGVGIGKTPFYPLDMADNDSARILKLVSKYDGDYEGFVFSIGNATQSGGSGGDYFIHSGGNVVTGASGSHVSGDAAHGNIGGTYQISGGFDAFANEGAVITVGGGNGTANGGDIILQGGSSDFGGIRSEIRIDGGHSSTDGKISITGSAEPASDSAYDLGSSSKRFKNIYVTGGSLHVGAINIKDSGYAAGKVLTITTSNNATWQTPSTSSGTVTSIATGLGLSGGTITTSGTLLIDTASASVISRQRAAATYLTIANPSATGSMTLTSTTNGFKNASLTTTQMNAVSSPTDGEQIWNTTEKALFTYNSDWGWEGNDFMWIRRNTLAYSNDFLFTTAGSPTISDGVLVTNGTLTGSVVTTDNTHPGIWSLSTSTSSTGATSLGTGNGSTTQPILLGGGRILYEVDIQIPILSTSSERFSEIHGFSSSNSSNAISNGYIFLYDEGGTINSSVATTKWKVQNVNGGSVTTDTTSVTVTAGSWYRLAIVVNATNTSVQYYINGTLAATETANITSAAVGIVNRIAKSVGTTARTFNIDYLQIKQRFTSSR